MDERQLVCYPRSGTCSLKAVLHAAIFRAASLATPLRDMLQDRCCCMNRGVTRCNILRAACNDLSFWKIKDWGSWLVPREYWRGPGAKFKENGEQQQSQSACCSVISRFVK